MKKNFLTVSLFALTFAVMIFNTVFAAVKSLTPDISDLPEGTLLKTSSSPNEKSQINFYLVENSMGCAVRGELKNDSLRKNIFWQTGVKEASIKWLSEKSVIINDIPLNIESDKFDSRRGTAIFSEGVTAEKIAENE